MFKHLKVGDTATRNFCGSIQKWLVTEVGERYLVIGLGWTFCRNCGAENDKDIGWDCTRTGSVLVQEPQNRG